MLYNQSNQWNGIPMPLLMSFTKPEKIQDETEQQPIIYDPVSQTVYDMRTVGTKSLKQTAPPPRSGNPDKKNDIDDSKNV